MKMVLLSLNLFAKKEGSSMYVCAHVYACLCIGDITVIIVRIVAKDR